MYTNSNGENILNKYNADYDPEKQRRYALTAGFATLLVSTLILVALGIS
ncbi:MULTISPECIES: hypothetical protein [unclassified Tolypothrix]|nr:MULTISPECIES: hypothetical protein [unclassified Tolypothrix]BAY89287.1 hypothetical protein NIES3275_12900 [Microchaete diplosiphon NIES-3275]EKE97781.1 hypothetical protein FDUTEX481_04731 [Tolypothrix sp. PCC 7601]MBE9084492.1 hypothetical protein [Tolypothrix sp. LEGE 11397]UYD23571.1 hypothetical protein HGR01_18805 [Tolypothrix sp. PCC 7712]UYD34201.1 hypothetical protein HG267_35965 [Tolypothrix sp. PCC 7601]